jgi:ribosomal protein S27AE
MNRVNTNEVYIWNFGDYFLVKCPRCKKSARVITNDEKGIPEVRFICLKCGYTKDWVRKSPGIAYCQNSDHFKEGEVWIGDAVDWYFHFPLWLQTPCCGHILWSYNHEHLLWLKSYVSAKLREQSKHEEYGWSNRSLASRLPKWIKKKNNREAILSAIEELRNL